MSGIKMMLGILAAGIVLHGFTGYAHQSLLQQGIAEEVLRFHVLANSDSAEDQEVKLKVRDAVLTWAEHALTYAKVIEDKNIGDNEIETHIKNFEKNDAEKDNEHRANRRISKEEVSEFLKGHLDEIKRLAEKILQESGYEYGASVKLQSCYFPDRTYKDCTFPSGWYDALRIELGEAKGKNWWCVFYPRLCFADYLHVVSENESTEVEQNETLEQILTVEEYELLLQNPKEWKIGFRWF